MHIFIALTLIMVSCIYIHICQNLSKYTLYVQLTVCQLLLNNAIFKNQRQCIGEGNDNPLQYSCLENSRDGGAWWAAVYGVAQSRTRLKRLSSSSSRADLWWIHCLPSLNSLIFNFPGSWFKTVATANGFNKSTGNLKL